MIRIFKVMTAVILCVLTALTTMHTNVLSIVLTALMFAITIRVCIIPSRFDNGKNHFDIDTRIRVCLWRCVVPEFYFTDNDTMMTVFNKAMLSSLKEFKDGTVRVGKYGFHRVRGYGPKTVVRMFIDRNLKEVY